MSLEIYYNVSTEQKEKETTERICAYREHLAKEAGKSRKEQKSVEKEN